MTNRKKIRLFIYSIIVSLVCFSRYFVKSDNYLTVTYYGVILFIFYVIFLDDKLFLYLEEIKEKFNQKK